MLIRGRLFKPANAHVLMVSFLLGGVGALLIGLQQSLKTAEDSIRPALQVVVFIQPTLSDDDSKKWATTLQSMDPDLESVTYISRQDALLKAQGNPALAKSLILLHNNPFPASVVLQYKDLAWLARPEPALTLKAQPQVLEIRWDPEARSVFRSLHEWRSWLLRISAFAVMMLSVWCFFGIYRFLAMKAPFGELFIQLGMGLIGGSLATATWGFALRDIGSDAALYRPETVSFWPLAAALMAALATFGWDVSHEN
jgi:cell division protein FtsX